MRSDGGSTFTWIWKRLGFRWTGLLEAARAPRDGGRGRLLDAAGFDLLLLVSSGSSILAAGPLLLGRLLLRLRLATRLRVVLELRFEPLLHAADVVGIRRASQVVDPVANASVASCNSCFRHRPKHLQKLVLVSPEEEGARNCVLMEGQRDVWGKVNTWRGGTTFVNGYTLDPKIVKVSLMFSKYVLLSCISRE